MTKAQLFLGDALTAYPNWPDPDLIISDGAYGIGGFPGDPKRPELLAQWYQPHIAEWTKRAQPQTTLWFWNTEQGWAAVHPLLLAAGWEYVQTITWDKGVGHVAGNVNGLTIRQFPVVTEVCSWYRRPVLWKLGDSSVTAQTWLRNEWLRAGLKLNEANAACGVKNAATRKYLTEDYLWYFPPAAVMQRLVDYANLHGRPDGRPYYSLDGQSPVQGAKWELLRHTWKHQHGITNAWAHPPLRSSERIKKPTSGSAALHLNQKPLLFMERIISACTKPGDVVWEPFGGLATATVAALHLGRRGYAAEINNGFAKIAATRLVEAELLAAQAS